ncbi:MAG TPA: mechanosensitive ion channel domain-containing protein [Rhodopila sp.]|uniref:mechanosensitive ion channel family protein n=1 Tax=Rhodopila sp. TaxID=2480087 RepID=UPI002CA47FFE|nr:mechanosensitive ion channel domain-containing protein [Rhodopila sp.]HVY17157.1 mechanosensitive ion channel domain-containing protein [Rhodopila sp.]
MFGQDPQHWLVDVRAAMPLVITNALHVLAALLILIIGFWIAGRAQSLVINSLNRTAHLDAMLKTFFGNIVRYFVLTIVVLAVLSQFGIQTTSLVAVLGAAGLAIGLALQGTLSHLAAGVMLLIFRPFRIGHHVQVSGVDGTVKELSLFWTEIVTIDAVQVIIPNGSVWGQPLRNFSVYPRPPATAEARFQLPGQDPAPARARIETVARSLPTVRKDPPATVLLDRNATTNALEFVVTFVPADDSTAVAGRSDIIQAVHDAFKASPTASAKQEADA